MTSTQAYTDGKLAAKAGVKLTDNPHDMDRSPALYAAWRRGWRKQLSEQPPTRLVEFYEAINRAH